MCKFVSVNELMNYNGVCRTALASPGLLITLYYSTTVGNPHYYGQIVFSKKQYSSGTVELAIFTNIFSLCLYVSLVRIQS